MICSIVLKKNQKLRKVHFIYDYKINTTQNIGRALEDDANEKSNYELTDEGICIKDCKQCKENKKCIKCREEYGLVGNKTNDELLCLPENQLSIGYYKNNESIYYKCIDFCEKCSNDISCENCLNNFTLVNNICIGQISNCENYYLNGTCKKCIENYTFEGEVRNKCLNKQIFLNDHFYTKDGGISFYSCNGEVFGHITNCNKCIFDESSLKLLCIDGELHIQKVQRFSAWTCSDLIENCDICEYSKKCIKCKDNHYLINNNSKFCVNIQEIIPIDEFFLDKNNTTYYFCNNSEFHSIPNCKKCNNNNSYILCNNGFTFIEGNKTKCFKIEELENKYYPDPNDISNYESCSKIDSNCLTCISYNICSSCAEGLGLNRYQNLCINISSKEYYKNDLDNLYYSCDIIKGCKQCLNNETCITCDEENYTLINNICLEISSLGNKYFKDENSSRYRLCREGIENCETCSSETEYIKCDNEYTKIGHINSNCYLISKLLNEYLPDPTDGNNYIKCSYLFSNCCTCNLSQCLTCHEGFIFINENFSNCISKLSIDLDEYFTEDNISYYSCKIDKYKNSSKCPISKNNKIIPTSIDESYYPLNIYTIFFLQIQLRENLIYIYIISDFNIVKDFSLTIKVIIYQPKILRGLQEFEKKEIELKAFPTNKENQNIIEISAELKNLINTKKSLMSK